jgi:hypothetical protein
VVHSPRHRAAIALVLQVFDVVVSIKSFYASTPPACSAGSGVFTSSSTRAELDTQLFPLAIWAGIHLRPSP